MMPNLNNLAVTLVSEKGKTPAKSSKEKAGKSDNFFNVFGNSKTKKESKKTGEEVTGAGVMPQFQFAKNPVASKNPTKEHGVAEIQKSGMSKSERASTSKSTSAFGTAQAKTEIDSNIKATSGGKAENLENKTTAKVLGNRIESTQSKILTRTDNETIQNFQNKNTPTTAVNKSEEIGKIHNLKKDLAVNEGLKVREKSEESTVKFSKEISPQWNGRSVSSVNELAAKSKGIANNDLKIASDNKSTEPSSNVLSNNVPTISSYGLKKMNDQMKLEEKVEGVKELRGVEKSFLSDKTLEKTDNIPFPQNFQGIRVDSKEVVKAPVNADARNDFNAIMQQVENGIKINYNNQLKEMKIKLQPEELGEVEIKMTMENNIMKAQFVVESQTVKDILESRFDNLRNALESKGFYGAEINVSVSTGENKNANNAFVFDQKNNREAKEIVPDYLAKVENLDNNSRVRKSDSSSNIDIMI